mmetsp:Transcript_30738/g.64468  ORF Transcript_30738/g.64468 Transcript_30738/m.64468 type:complete len:118 (-) Transcript_30738:302-655(-)
MVAERAAAFQHSLIKERAALEERLRHINTLIQGRAPPTLRSQQNTAGVASFDSFADSIGLEPSTVRLVLLVSLILFLCMRGRAISRAVGVLLITSLINVWAMGRIFLRRVGLSIKSD